MSAPSLSALRVRLTLWYAGTFALILALLGLGVLYTIRNQLSGQLERSLERSVAEAKHGATGEPAAAQPARVSIYRFGAAGQPIEPSPADPWIVAAANLARRNGVARDERDVPGDTTLRLYAERYLADDSTPRVAVAVASSVEIEDRYSALIVVFAAAAGFAVILVAAGGLILARVSTAPVEASIAHMRRFIGDAAHELRMPLAVLRSRTEVALQQPRDAAVYADALQHIARDAKHLGDIVDDLFILTRADAGEQPRMVQQLSLDDIVAEATQSVRVMAQTKGVALELTEFEEARVDGDAVLLRRLMLIVLDNALKFTPPGGSVSVRVGTAGERPFAIVEDTGIGIAPDHLAHIFDRFYRVDPARTRRESEATNHGGAGLGLSIAQWIASAHHADVDVTSTLGRGTRVAVKFRAAAEAFPARSAPASP